MACIACSADVCFTAAGSITSIVTHSGIGAGEQAKARAADRCSTKQLVKSIATISLKGPKIAKSTAVDCKAPKA